MTIQKMMEKVAEHGRCCITGKPFNGSLEFYMIQTDYIATWKEPYAMPVNEYSKIEAPKLAVGFMSAGCFGRWNDLSDRVKEVVEFNIEGDIVYHPVAELKKWVNPALN